MLQCSMRRKISLAKGNLDLMRLFFSERCRPRRVKYLTSGFPLSELFKGSWTASESAKPFRSYLRDCDTKTELLEKMHHRVLVLITLAQENILGDSINFDYATFLLREAEKIVKKSLKSNAFCKR